MADCIYLTPPVDAVPVVRCKDCIYYDDGACVYPNGLDLPAPDWFCCFGAHREQFAGAGKMHGSETNESQKN